MDNYESDFDRNVLKEFVLELLNEVENQRNLSGEEFEIVATMILEQLERTDTAPLEFLGIVTVGVIMVGWLKLNFLPSQLPHNFELSATFFRMAPIERAPDAPAPSGMSQFWDGIYSKGMSGSEDASRAFDLCLEDPSLPQWARVTALQLKVWHHAKLEEFSQARGYADKLRDNLSVSQSKADYILGYIEALEDNMLATPEPELDDDKFIMIPEAVPTEFSLIQAQTVSVSLSDSAIETLTRALSERIETRVLSGLWQAKEEIIRSIPVTYSLEGVSQRLRDDYGDWVSKLANPGALINAEFLFEALKAKSWSAVVTEYSNVIEAEITVKLLPWLGRIMSEKGSPLESILLNRVENGGSFTGYTEILLRTIASNAIWKSYLSALPVETQSFLLYKLPDSLAILRGKRNPLAHGGIANANEAKEMRVIVLGNDDNSGLLKRLNEIVGF